MEQSPRAVWPRGAYLSGHGGDPAQGDGSCKDVLAEAGVLWVLQVADAAADSVFIFHVSSLDLLVDMCQHGVKEVEPTGYSGTQTRFNEMERVSGLVVMGHSGLEHREP